MNELSGRVLVDSGAAVVGAPWYFGEGYDTMVPHDPPSLAAIDGTPINYCGRRNLNFAMGSSTGSMQCEVCDISKPVLAVSRMAKGGIGTWFAPEGLGKFWLCDEQGHYIELPSTGGLINATIRKLYL